MTAKGTVVIKRAAELRLLSDPKKLRIFEALRDAPASPHQLALRFGVKPTALYHHFARLERAGFIAVAEKRQRRGVVEKLYRAAAQQIIVDRALVETSRGARSVQAVLAAASAIVRVTIEDIHAAVLDPTEPLADRDRSEVATTISRVSPAKARALMQRVRSLLDFATRNDGTGEHRIRLTLAILPVAPAAMPARKRLRKR